MKKKRIKQTFLKYKKIHTYVLKKRATRLKEMKNENTYTNRTPDKQSVVENMNKVLQNLRSIKCNLFIE